MTKPEVSVLITDLDNTLFDWVGAWYAAYSAFIDVLSWESGIGKETLYAESQRVFQRHQTSEYAFLLQELPSLRGTCAGQEVTETYKRAISAYDDARRSSLRLYPGVQETLLKIRQAGTLIVGYTESMSFYSVRRMKNLKLDGVLDVLFTQDEHDLPEGVDLAAIRTHPSEAYELQRTALETTPRGEIKPSERILRFIIDKVGGNKDSAAYVGDNLGKDVLMAQAAGILDIHARYGQAHTREEYELLKKVTHWTPEQVAREKELTHIEVHPTLVLRESFCEILSFVDFVPQTEGHLKPDHS